MMAVRGVHTLLLTLTWTTFSSSTSEIHQFQPRIRVNRENVTFVSFSTSDGQKIDNLKLVHDPTSVNIYAGGPQSLYWFNPGGRPVLEQVHVNIYQSECQSNPAVCGYDITLLKEGRNGNPLFMCGTREEKTVCCDVNSEHRPVSCEKMLSPTEINEPSVHVGDSLYYTISNENNNGLYRWTKERTTWPPPIETKQRYVKILVNQGNGSLDRKVYSFYTEQNLNQDPDMPLWIPRVSQSCMADRGGSKAVLQYRWTSMLTARLFCGDEKKHLSYPELLDVAVLEAAEWENTTIYGLFRNAYNLTAVCVYKMSDIIRVFKSNEFKDTTETFSSHHPGECVENSPSLPSNLLHFMEARPEMKQRIKPVRDPLLSRHFHYTHLQVDRVKSSVSGNRHHNVLLMSLENGRIHKLLEQNGDGVPFIITEYKPFKSRTHISSMLLDSERKKLFVSSNTEVIQMDLNDCSLYGKDCDSCVMARDPYCAWDFTCSDVANAPVSSIQDVINGDHSKCEKVDLPKSSESRTDDKRDSPTSVPEDSKFYLKCPMESQHASYAWFHNDRRIECVSAEQDCLLLIDSMSKEDEGVYKCSASENGYDMTIVSQELRTNSASETRTTHIVLACLLFLVYMVC